MPASIWNPSILSYTTRGNHTLHNSTLLIWELTSKHWEYKFYFCSPRRHYNVLHRHDGRPRSVRGQINPMYREPRIPVRRERTNFPTRCIGSRESQSGERERIFPLQASVDVSLNVRYTSPGQACGFLQPDVGVDDEEKTATFQQTAAREEFARPSNERQQQRMTEWTTKESRQFDPGG